MKHKILVTGGAGYIGSHTIIELINAGYEPVSADNYSNSSPVAYDLIEKITGQKIKAYNVDLCDNAATRKLFNENKDIAGIIHFAAFKAVGESVEQPLKYYHNNISSLVNILECVKEFGIKNFIFSSSCSVYGNIQSLPVSESTPLSKAESPYAYTKQIGEMMLRDFTRATPGIDVIALRYFNPVGAHSSGLIGENPINPPTNLVPVITQTAIGKIPQMKVFGDDYDTRDGTCIRDYVHVVDIADAHVRALDLLMTEKNNSNFIILNLGTGNGVSVLEAINSFKKVTGRELNYIIAPRRSGDVEAIYSDNSKVKEMLGWEPKYTLDDMMATAWKWQQNADKLLLS